MINLFFFLINTNLKSDCLKSSEIVCKHVLLSLIYFYFKLIKNTILTALTPQTTVVFPSLTKAEPSAVDIEPENID